MRRFVRALGTLMIVAGACSLGWAVLVWQWQDPVTAFVNHREQGKLADRYEQRLAEFRLPAASPASAPSSAELRRLAQRYRRTVKIGEPLGRLHVGRLGLNTIVINGTDTEPLKKGPGRDPHTFMPGVGKLVYVAGHRTTYGAPFSRIDRLQVGDPIVLEVPYATFHYRITGHVVVPASDVGRLRSRGREEIALQACEPRFFASHRYIAYAKLERVEAPAGAGDSPASVAAPG